MPPVELLLSTLAVMRPNISTPPLMLNVVSGAYSSPMQTFVPDQVAVVQVGRKFSVRFDGRSGTCQ